MLVVRNEQIQILRAHMTKQFENRMVEHVREFFPEDFVSLGEDEVRENIRYGIDRARTYEIAIEHDVSRYINLMFTFGKDYDQDPAVPWAAEILNDPEVEPSSKMDRLYEEAEKHVSDAASIRKKTEKGGS